MKIRVPTTEYLFIASFAYCHFDETHFPPLGGDRNVHIPITSEIDMVCPLMICLILIPQTTQRELESDEIAYKCCNVPVSWRFLMIWNQMATWAISAAGKPPIVGGHVTPWSGLLNNKPDLRCYEKILKWLKMKQTQFTIETKNIHMFPNHNLPPTGNNF